MQITADDIGDIANGSAFLATGGGGDPYVSSLLARQVLSRCGGVELLPLSDLRADALVIAVGGIGAPLISLEKLPNGSEECWAIDALEAQLGKKADALVSFEVGGFNSLVTFIAAALRGIPVVDADGMGRAFPEMQMTTFSISGVNGTPMALVDEHKNRVIITAQSTRKAEQISRQVALAMGGQCTSAESAMSGEIVRKAAIPGSMSFCLKVGRALAGCRGDSAGFLQSLQALAADSPYGAVRRLCVGKVTGVTRDTQGGFDVGRIDVVEIAGAGRSLSIRFKNEYLALTRGDDVLAVVPDLICIIDSETAVPITSDRIRYGQRITIVGMEAPQVYRTARALRVVGPDAFGIEARYQPLSQLSQ